MMATELRLGPGKRVERERDEDKTETPTATMRKRSGYRKAGGDPRETGVTEATQESISRRKEQ
jgi:hypothetical protein